MRSVNQLNQEQAESDRQWWSGVRYGLFFGFLAGFIVAFWVHLFLP